MNRFSQKALVADAIPKDDASETIDTSNPTIPTAVPVDDPTFLLAATPISRSARRVVSGASTSVSSSPLSLPIVALSVLFGVVLSALVCMTQHTSITRMEWERLQHAHVQLDAIVAKTQTELERIKRTQFELDARLSATQAQVQTTHVKLDAMVAKTQTEWERLQRTHVALDARLSATQEQVQAMHVELDARLSATQTPSQLQNPDLTKTVPVFTDSSARKRMQSRMCPLCACRTSPSSTCQSLVKRARDTFVNFDSICTICPGGASPTDNLPADQQIDSGLAMMDKSVSPRQGCPVTQWLLNQGVSVGGIMQILNPNLLHDLLHDIQQRKQSIGGGDTRVSVEMESMVYIIKETGKTSFYNSMSMHPNDDRESERLVQHYREHLPFFTDTSLANNLRDVVQKVQTGLSAMHIKNAEMSSLTTEIMFWFYAGHLGYSPWQCQRIDGCRHEIERGTHSIFRSVIAISEHERIEIG